MSLGLLLLLVAGWLILPRVVSLDSFGQTLASISILFYIVIPFGGILLIAILVRGAFSLFRKSKPLPKRRVFKSSYWWLTSVLLIGLLVFLFLIIAPGRF